MNWYRIDLSLNSIGAAMRRLAGNVLAPSLYCIYVLQLLVIIVLEASRDTIAGWFKLAICSLRPFYCYKKVRDAQGRFSAEQCERTKLYFSTSWAAVKSRFCDLPQKSSESSEKIIGATLSGDWLHSVLGGLPLISSRNMEGSQGSRNSMKTAAPQNMNDDTKTTRKENGNKETLQSKQAKPQKSQVAFPRLFSITKPAASAPVPSAPKLLKSKGPFHSAEPASWKTRALFPSKANTAISDSSSTVSEFRNPWTEQKQRKLDTSTNQPSQVSPAEPPVMPQR
ncbi:predicted protein [Clavispora lusitaniae ATCC 42720]|uniref:Uncharacterized protein n=1 Tax=Clavispora lusitaniae (strain ATCC 42720) TaxID=306902 RepID=C4XYY1_CLAL4|nr:uncharacterized protein CLUG_01154 [Clavispora lusitaniae ATCC 42720]EEQ37031.1 predicted protein [Clavispora lusitaniae ATCC 42720]